MPLTAGESMVRSRMRGVGTRRFRGLVSTAMMRAPSSAGSPIAGAWLLPGANVGIATGVGVGARLAVGASDGVELGLAPPEQPVSTMTAQTRNDQVFAETVSRTTRAPPT